MTNLHYKDQTLMGGGNVLVLTKKVGLNWFSIKKRNIHLNKTIWNYKFSYTIYMRIIISILPDLVESYEEVGQFDCDNIPEIKSSPT